MDTSEYEIYAQPKDLHEGAIAISSKRYYSKDKRRAFSFTKYLNDHESKEQVWRIATRVRNKILFDIDNPDIQNIHHINDYYVKLFGELDVFKTNGGYHIHSRKIYSNEWEWHYDCCRVLYPLLETKDILKYLGKLKEWYNGILKEEFEEKWNREKYICEVKDRLINSSGLYCGVGDFDVIFALMVIFKGYYCVRITKKNPDDKVIKIKLGSRSINDRSNLLPIHLME